MYLDYLWMLLSLFFFIFLIRHMDSIPTNKLFHDLTNTVIDETKITVSVLSSRSIEKIKNAPPEFFNAIALFIVLIMFLSGLVFFATSNLLETFKEILGVNVEKAMPSDVMIALLFLISMIVFTVLAIRSWDFVLKHKHNVSEDINENET